MSLPYDKLCRMLGYQFTRVELLQTALTHRSYGSPNNERLEFLGDAVLSVAISEALYLKFPAGDEGMLSRLRARLVNGDTLAEVARRLELGEQLRMGPGELKSGGFRRDSILAGALEAIIGAVYVEGGFDTARRLILSVFQRELDEVSIERINKDPKTLLQEYLQARRQALPDYQVTGVEGQDHAQIFRVQCRIPGLVETGAGEGSSRRRAEQDAAARVLERLRANKGEDSHTHDAD